MSCTRTPSGYVIRVLGRLDEHWSDRFGGLTLHADDGVTTLRGDALDQAALHGVLAAIRDAGVTLVSIEPLPGAQSGP